MKHLNRDICDFVSIDWQTPIETARALVDKSVGLQGNIDPRLLYAEESVIEKHFTINKKLKGPDHKASLEPDELKSMISAIRNIEIAILLRFIKSFNPF